MTKTWVISDTHFGHQGVCDFTQADGVTPYNLQLIIDKLDVS